MPMHRPMQCVCGPACHVLRMGTLLRACGLCVALLALQTSPQTLPMQVESWSHIEEWRPFVREVAQVVLNHVDGATSVEQILEHRTHVAPTVAYQVEVEFGPSSDGRRKPFNATARVFDDAFEWYAVSGTTLHTHLWLKEQRELHGPPPPPPTTHSLGLLDGRPPKDTIRRQQVQLPPLLPHEIPNTMDIHIHGAAQVSLVPSVPAEQLVSGDAVPSGLLVDVMSIQSGVSATLHGVEAMSLAGPVPLECDLPFRWHPPMVFPPLEGGRRLAGWFVVSGLAKVESGGALSVTLSPSPDQALRSLPKGWVPVGLAGIVATWDIDGEDHEEEEEDFDEAESEDVQWKSQLLRDLGLQEANEDEDAADVAEEEVTEGDDSGGVSAELLRFMGTDQEAEVTMPHELSGSHAQDLVFFKGMLTDYMTGLPLSFCPGGFSMARPTVTLPEGRHQDAPLLIEDPLASKPAQWNDVEDGDWAPAMVVNPSAVANSLGLGPGWEGSYECVGNPTRASMNILETEPGRAPNTIRIVANMSFDTVTQTGGFSVRLAHAEEPLKLQLAGGGATVGAGNDATDYVGYSAEVIAAKQEQETELILRPRAAYQEVARKASDTRKISPFHIDPTDLRVESLLSSVERVFNQTKQVAIRLTAASVQPIVIFRVVLDIAVPGDILRVEAVVEREWGGVKRPKPVVLTPSLAENDFAHVTSLVSKSLLRGDRAIDLVELAEQLKLAPEAVETLQRALMMESESRDDATDEDSSDTSGEPVDSQTVDEGVREQDSRAELLSQKNDHRGAQGSDAQAGDRNEPATTQDGADGASDTGLDLLLLGGRGVRMMRETLRQAVNYNVFAAMWRTLQQGYRDLMGIPVGVAAPVQAGLLLVAAVPLVIMFVSLLGLLEFRAINQRGAGEN